MTGGIKIIIIVIIIIKKLRRIYSSLVHETNSKALRLFNSSWMILGSGRVGSGRIGSQNLDTHATLRHRKDGGPVPDGKFCGPRARWIRWGPDSLRREKGERGKVLPVVKYRNFARNRCSFGQITSASCGSPLRAVSDIRRCLRSKSIYASFVRAAATVSYYVTWRMSA